jgi:hypothetical protein
MDGSVNNAVDCLESAIINKAGVYMAMIAGFECAFK